MPKRPSTALESENGAAAASDDATTTSSSKRAKTADGKKPVSASAQRDENGDRFWELSSGGTRRVTVNKFMGRWMVNVREYYEQDGKLKPGKKGISLPVDQFSALLQVLPQIEGVLKDEGVRVPRPDYTGDAIAASAVVDEDMGEDDYKAQLKKSNHEATSDEEE